MMRAIKLKSAPPGDPEYSPTNPAPSSAFELRDDIPKPKVSKPSEVVVQVKATTVTRGSLAWPELYGELPAGMGNDFSGIVVEVHPNETEFKAGEEVYGMTSADKGSAWAEYVLATADEAYQKPQILTWEEAAALPMSALTADQALFKHAGLELEASTPKRVLVTGATGAVGMFLVRFAAAAGHHVLAFSRSLDNGTEAFLSDLGATEVLNYNQLSGVANIDAVIDTVGVQALETCWGIVRPGGCLISVETNSWDFVDRHTSSGVAGGMRAHITALFFIVEPSRKSMARISKFVDEQGIKGQVAAIYAMRGAQIAYDLVASGRGAFGKTVLVP